MSEDSDDFIPKKTSKKFVISSSEEFSSPVKATCSKNIGCSVSARRQKTIYDFFSSSSDSAALFSPTKQNDMIKEEELTVNINEKSMSQEMDSLVVNKINNDRLDEMERQLNERIKSGIFNIKVENSSSEFDEDFVPADMKSINLDNSGFNEPTLYSSLSRKSLFTRKSMFKRFCYCSVFNNLCKLIKLPPRTVSNLLQNSLLCCNPKVNSKSFIESLLKLYSVTLDKLMLDKLSQVILQDTAKLPSLQLDANVLEELFINFGFRENVCKIPEETHVCPSCDAEPCSRDTLFTKVSFFVNFFANNLVCYQSTLSNELASRLTCLFLLLMQVENQPRLVADLRLALEKMCGMFTDWSGIKMDLFKQTIARVNSCSEITAIVCSIPTNSRRCQELSRWMSFFTIRELLNLNSDGMEKVAEDFDIVNLESIASLTTDLTLKRFEEVRPFNQDLNHLVVVFCCIKLLSSSLSSLHVTASKKIYLLKISKALQDLNYSIRIDGRLLTQQVKLEIGMFISKLTLMVEQIQTSVTGYDTFFKHLDKMQVVDEVVEDGNSTFIHNSGISSDESYHESDGMSEVRSLSCKANSLSLSENDSIEEKDFLLRVTKEIKEANLRFAKH